MADPTIETFEQFWDFYVDQHKKKATRALHFVGTTAAIGCLAGGLLTKRRWLLLMAPVVGYGPAWLSHFLIEKNRPASFAYPLWSLQADFLMWWKTLSGTMQAEVDRVGQAVQAQQAPQDAHVDAEARPPVRSDAVN